MKIAGSVGAIRSTRSDTVGWDGSKYFIVQHHACAFELAAGIVSRAARTVSCVCVPDLIRGNLQR
jgi:hypothetical protein